MLNLPFDPNTATSPVCTDETAARLFWDHVDHLGDLPCADKMAALRHVALCLACAAKLKALEETDTRAAEPSESHPC